MSLLKVTFLAGGLSLALVSGVFAQAGKTGSADANDPWNFDAIPDGIGMPVGTAKAAKAGTMRTGKNGHAAQMAGKTVLELSSKTMIYKKNGKLYVVTNRKLPDKAMLFDQAKDWEGD